MLKPDITCRSWSRELGIGKPLASAASSSRAFSGRDAYHQYKRVMQCVTTMPPKSISGNVLDMNCTAMHSYLKLICQKLANAAASARQEVMRVCFAFRLVTMHRCTQLGTRWNTRAWNIRQPIVGQFPVSEGQEKSQSSNP